MRLRSHRERLAAVVAVGVGLGLFLLVLAATPADAVCGGGGGFGDVGDVWGECTGNTPGQPPTSNQQALWEHYCLNTPQAEDWGLVWQDVPGERELRFFFVGYLRSDEYVDLNFDPTGVYGWYTIGCVEWFDEDSGGPAWGWVDNGVEVFEVTPPVPVQTILDRAKARVDPPYPTLGAAPPFEDVIVKAQTWLWLDGYPWEPWEETETQGMVTVYVVATPTRVEWEMGDSGLAVCSGPGVPWSPGADEADSDCHYTFVDSSAILPGGEFAGSANAVFDVEWWMDDPWNVGRYMGENGTIERETFFTIDVDEIQAIETGG